MNPIAQKTLGILSLPVFAMLHFACDTSEEPKSSEPSPPPPGVSMGTGGLAPIGDGDGEMEISLGDGDAGQIVQGMTCAMNADCLPLVCHPISQTCEQSGASCSAHAECAAGSYCEPTTGTCLPGKSGAPCDTDTNCESGGKCTGGTCGCAGFAEEQEVTEAKLDIYYVFDHSTSMGADCAYSPGTEPPVSSKACLATYAFSDYLLAQPPVDTRLGLQFMSFPGMQGEDYCDGVKYAEPLIDLTQLPLDPGHQMIQAISDDLFTTRGTEIEGALRGIAQYTAANKVPDREMIGVLMTDGDPMGCDNRIENLAAIVADHYSTTGIRIFIIGMEGATETNLEQIAAGGGAVPHDDFCGSLTPPCHYWNVGDGSGDVLSQALNAIIDQSAPLSCEFPLSSIQPADGQVLDTATINVTFTGSNGVETTIYNVGSEAECPPGEMAWHYDNPAEPTSLQLCASTCEIVAGTENGAEINITGGCEATVVIPR